MGKVLVPEDPAHFSHLGHPSVCALECDGSEMVITVYLSGFNVRTNYIVH